MTGKFIKILLLILFLQVVGNKYVLGNNSFSIIEKTFKNIQNLNDNNLDTFANSGDLKNSEQQIVLNLRKKRYIKEINIVWGKINFPFNLRILSSADYVNWKLLKVLKITMDESKIKTDESKIKINNKVAQFIKLYIPQDIKFLNKKYIVKIAELQIKYSKNVKPKIFNVKIVNRTKNSVKFKWNSDYETFGQIRYGLDVNSINNVKTEYFFTKNHKLQIDNLLRGTKYFFQIVNLTAENKVFTTPVKTFKTKGIPLPKINNIIVKKKYYNGIDLEIKANVRVKLKIKYGMTENNLKRRIIIKKFKKNHIVKIRNLYPLTEYYYKLEIGDNKNNKFDTVGKFTTDEYNIALHKKVFGTFYNKYIGDIFTLKGKILNRVTDGSFNYREGMAVSFDPSASEQFVVIDTGKIQEINRVITYWRALAYPYFYFIYYSDNNKDWHKYASLIKLKGKSSVRIKGSGMPLIIGNTDIKNLKTRYIKIYIPRGTPYYKKFSYYKFLQLVEVKIYGVCKKNTVNK